MMINLGCNMNLQQAYSVLRGLKTLGIRIDRARQNAPQVASFLERHPQYNLGKKQMRGNG